MTVIRISQIIVLLVVVVAPAGASGTAGSGGRQIAVMEAPGKAPSSPVDAQNADYIGHIGGSMYALAVQGNYAYVGEGGSLTILDITKAQARR